MKLPRRVTISDGSYYFVQCLEERSAKTGKPKQKWHRLCRVTDGESAMLKALAILLGEDEKPKSGDMPERIKEFQLAHFPTLSPGVKKEYERMFGKIEEAFTLFNVADVIPGDVLEFLANFNNHPTARSHYKARLSTFFAWCVNKDYIKHNPCAEIRVPKPTKRKGRMTDDSFWLIHKHLPPIGQVFLELLFLTRQRPTEIRLLQEKHIGEKYIKFKPSKTAKSSGEEVDIIITPAINDALERARKLASVRGLPGSQAYLIQTIGGSPYTRSGMLTMWRKACKEAGIEGVTTRDVRPYALNAMEKAGYSLQEIQKAAAHTTSAMTEHYLNQHRERISDAAITLPEKQKT